MLQTEGQFEIRHGRAPIRSRGALATGISSENEDRGRSSRIAERRWSWGAAPALTSYPSQRRAAFSISNSIADAAPGNGADFINATNNIPITGGTTPNSVFSLALVSLNSMNQPGALVDFNPTQNHAFTRSTAADGINGFASNKFAIDTTGFAI